ncbi:Myosin heavy chain, embryonic smooth muscle isoform, putative [Ricinus communis]|uniref:Myosin heavy chain, embryonic smooth muscle isoform, putative n=1 Tax=Ricinus communis TaxID=3988 RepID=B9S4G6_RICCO|nr:Myosin heavy chain, embryonic smooth muscle isoform, putative [Ricinus communis]|eukprot:XP_002520885.1 protein NETWORKED 4A [Ricinus communis]
MDQTASRVLKMIEQDGASLAKKAEMCKMTRPDLIAEIEEFCSLYRSLAERYDHLNAELYKSTPSEFQMQDAGSAPDTPMLTPDQKLGLHQTGHQVESASSGGASSDLSPKDGSDSSSSSDSESDSFNSSGDAYYSLPVNSDRKGLHQKIIELRNGLPIMDIKLQLNAEDNGDCMLDAQEKENYEELLGRSIMYEEELRDSKLKLQLSEEEVARLKGELEKRESDMVLAETLQGQLELAHTDLRMREADLEVERIRVMELQQGLADRTNELQGHLKLAQEEINMLRTKLDSEFWQALDLQERIVQYKNDVSALDDEVKASKLALLNAEENFLAEKAHLQSNISSLLERETMLEARLRDWELKGESLEEKLKQCETEKKDLQLVYDIQRIGLQGEISELKVELGDKGGHLEIVNKNLDSLKFKYDMVMAEKDGMNAKINTLIADLSSRDNEIGQMEERLRRIRIENAELIAGSESLQRTVNELRLRVVELEKEVDKQRGELSAGAEEKREAIRQLCFSLEHYRSGYKELCQAFHKRHAVMAS